MPAAAPAAAAKAAAVLPKATKQAHNRLYRKKHKKNKGTGSASFPTLFYDLSLKQNFGGRTSCGNFFASADIDSPEGDSI